MELDGQILDFPNLAPTNGQVESLWFPLITFCPGWNSCMKEKNWDGETSFQTRGLNLSLTRLPIVRERTMAIYFIISFDMVGPFLNTGGLNEQLATTQREDAVSFGLIAPKLCQHWTCWLGMMRRSTLVLGCCVKISHGWCRYIGCKPWVFSVPGKDRKVVFH